MFGSLGNLGRRRWGKRMRYGEALHLLSLTAVSLWACHEMLLIVWGFEELKSRPQLLEKEPAWCSQTSSLNQAFLLSNAEGKSLRDKSDDRASPGFLEKSKLVWVHSTSFFSGFSFLLKL